MSAKVAVATPATLPKAVHSVGKSSIPKPTRTLSDAEWPEYIRASILKFSQQVWEEYDSVSQQKIFGDAGRLNLLDVNSALAEAARANKDPSWIVDQLNTLLN